MSEQVLNMPELLNAIFWSLDRDSNTSNAIVCKRWSDVALDVLWYEVEGLARLFNILAPLVWEEDEDEDEDEDECYAYNFTRSLDFSDWKRFDRYRFRVKSLSHQKPYIYVKVFDEIARSRTSLVIFPNLHTLKWLDGSNLELCVIFMHENIKQFTIELHGDGSDHLLRDVAMRMPHITHFGLDSDASIIINEPDITKLLPCLPDLRELRLPPIHFTTKIAEAVAYNEKLETIAMGNRAHSPEPDDLLNPQLKEGAYPSLSKLAICNAYRIVSTFLQNLPALANLTEIHIMSQLNERPADIARLVDVIAKKCQRLRSLNLASYKQYLDPSDSESDSGNGKDYISFDDLRPLFQSLNLVHCTIVHTHPLLLQLADLEQMATSIPNVETLILNMKRYSKHHNPKLNLDALLPFARHCPKLRTLGLYMNAVIDDHQYTLNLNLDHPAFRELRCLSVGCSLIDDEYRVAWFLSLICPMECIIESEGPDSSCKKWQETNKFLSLLMKVRAEERERAKLSLNKNQT